MNATEREGVHWYPEFDQPLGAPLGPASVDGTVLTRRFASGTTARFNMSSGDGSIAWASPLPPRPSMAFDGLGMEGGDA